MDRITFDVVQPVSPADPNRMDVACFIGFVPLRSSGRLPDTLHTWLTRNHWDARALPSETAPAYDLLDVLRERKADGISVGICIEDEEYQELALRHDWETIATIITTVIILPILPDLIGDYIKNRLGSRA